MLDQMTRRQMIGGLAVAGPLAALGLSACGGGGDDTAAAAATTAAATGHDVHASAAPVDHGPVGAPREPHTTYPAKAPPRSTTKIHTIEFEVDEHLLEIAEDRTMLAWCFAEKGRRFDNRQQCRDRSYSSCGRLSPARMGRRDAKRARALRE